MKSIRGRRPKFQNPDPVMTIKSLMNHRTETIDPARVQPSTAALNYTEKTMREFFPHLASQGLKSRAHE